ncbi:MULTISPECIES: hypothetical protein [Streptomyces violaceusniger group]|uniref:Uncharacterized protein n=1 Tax=Streptomyces rhizosphaericus TaxID=114699 RepID=A0ABP3ZGB9_9ACTN|nr:MULTISPECIES: hypothetical protein [Streptomyces violaceusniger group]
MKRLFRRCATAPGALTPEDQAAVDAFRAMLATKKHVTVPSVNGRRAGRPGTHLWGRAA